MSLLQSAAVGLILAGGCFIQSAVGFGFGLFVMPLFALVTALPLPNAIGLMAAAGTFQALLAVHHLRRHAGWKAMGPLLLCGILGLQLGVWLLSLLQGLEKEIIQQAVGVILLSLLAIQYLLDIEPRERVGFWWGVAAFSASGVLSGLVGMGGPFVVLWAWAHKWPAQRIRATILIVITVLIPFQLVFLVRQFGRPVVACILFGGVFVPVALLGTWIGLRVGNRVPRSTLRNITLFILLGIAGASIVKPWLM